MAAVQCLLVNYSIALFPELLFVFLISLNSAAFLLALFHYNTFFVAISHGFSTFQRRFLGL